jgi:hypothetical protein
MKLWQKPMPERGWLSFLHPEAPEDGVAGLGAAGIFHITEQRLTTRARCDMFTPSIAAALRNSAAGCSGSGAAAAGGGGRGETLQGGGEDTRE